MAHTVSVRKRVRQANRANLWNTAIHSSVRTALKKVATSIQSKDLESVQALEPLATSQIDKAARRGVIHKSAAARHKRRLSARVKTFKAELASTAS